MLVIGALSSQHFSVVALLRNFSMKAKNNVPDFKKKKVKVGKTVPRSNVTKITIRSKKLFIPLQTSITSKDITTYKELLEKITKKLNHYNTSAKISAFDECKNFLNTCDNPSSHIAIIIPTALEILYDDDKDVRSALISFMSMALKKCDLSAFSSVASIIVTFLCSGLTSLHKGIRKDSLVLTELVSANHPLLLSSEFSKILGFMLTLMSDSALNTGPQSFLTLVAAPLSKPTKSSKQSKPTSALVLILRILSRLLNLQLPKTSETQSHWRNDQTSEQIALHSVWRLDIPNVKLYNAAIVLSASRYNSYKSSSSLNWSSDAIDALLERMYSFWKDYSLNESVVSLPTISILTNILSVVTSTSEILNSTIKSVSTSNFSKLLDLIMNAFPYKSAELMTAGHGSHEALISKKQSDALNILICNLSLTHRKHLSRDPFYSSCARDTTYSKAVEFVFESFRELSESISDAVKHSFVEENSCVADEQSETNSMVDDDSSDSEDIGSGDDDVYIKESKKTVDKVKRSKISEDEDINLKLLNCASLLTQFLMSSTNPSSELHSIVSLLGEWDIFFSTFKLDLTSYTLQSNQALPAWARHSLKQAITMFTSSIIAHEDFWVQLRQLEPACIQSLDIILKCINSMAGYFFNDRGGPSLSSVLHFPNSLQEVIYQTTIYILQRVDYDLIVESPGRLVSVQNLCQIIFQSCWVENNPARSKVSLAAKYFSLDVFYYGFFIDFFEQSSNILLAIAKDEDESIQRYFLQVLYERRENISSEQFVRMLLTSLDIALTCKDLDSDFSKRSLMFLAKQSRAFSQQVTEPQPWRFVEAVFDILQEFIHPNTESIELELIISWIACKAQCLDIESLTLASVVKAIAFTWMIQRIILCTGNSGKLCDKAVEVWRKLSIWMTIAMEPMSALLLEESSDSERVSFCRTALASFLSFLSTRSSVDKAEDMIFKYYCLYLKSLSEYILSVNPNSKELGNVAWSTELIVDSPELSVCKNLNEISVRAADVVQALDIATNEESQVRSVVAALRIIFSLTAEKIVLK